MRVKGYRTRTGSGIFWGKGNTRACTASRVFDVFNLIRKEAAAVRLLETGTIATCSESFRSIRLIMHAAVSNLVINLENC